MSTLHDILNKVYPKLRKEGEQFEFDFPEYGSCLTPAEIKGLSPEHVDAIQYGVSEYQDKHVSQKDWVKAVLEQYNTIVPPRSQVRTRSVVKKAR